MSAHDAFRLEQRQVAVRMLAAALIAGAAIGGAIYFASGVPRPFTERIATAFKADLFVVFWLFATIANVACLRFFSPEDIAGSAGTTKSRSVRDAGAVLQNTLEQVVLAALVYLAIAVVFKRPMPLIVALTGLFSLGRLLFWIGYASGAPGRAFGFALTFYPSAVSLLVAVVALLSGGSAINF
jgi:hypothetical protein